MHAQKLEHAQNIEAYERDLTTRKRREHDLLALMNSKDTQQTKDPEELKEKYNSEQYQVAVNYEGTIEKHKSKLDKLRAQNCRLAEQCDGFDSQMGQLVNDFDNKHRHKLQVLKEDYGAKMVGVRETHSRGA